VLLAVLVEANGSSSGHIKAVQQPIPKLSQPLHIIQGHHHNCSVTQSTKIKPLGLLLTTASWGLVGLLRCMPTWGDWFFGHIPSLQLAVEIRDAPEPALVGNEF